MDNKCLSFIVGSLLILPLVGVGLVAGISKVSQVHAQEITLSAPANHLKHMSQMMDADDQKQMVVMMSKHHGKDWEKECNTMLKTMNMNS